jgi:hypothetical protein
MNFQHKARPQSNDDMLQMLAFLNDPNQYQAKLKALTDKEAQVNALIANYREYKTAADMMTKAKSLMTIAEATRTDAERTLEQAKIDAAKKVSEAQAQAEGITNSSRSELEHAWAAVERDRKEIAREVARAKEAERFHNLHATAALKATEQAKRDSEQAKLNDALRVEKIRQVLDGN